MWYHYTQFHLFLTIKFFQNIQINFYYVRMLLLFFSDYSIFNTSLYIRFKSHFSYWYAV